MDSNKILRELRVVQKKYEHECTPTFGICVSAMAKDSADTIEELQEKIKELIKDTNNKIHSDYEECDCRLCTNQYNLETCPNPGNEKVINCSKYVVCEHGVADLTEEDIK